MVSRSTATSEDIGRQFARRLRFMRRQKAWTQERLAEEAGLSAKYIGQLERAELSPSLRVLVRLAGALGTPLHDLLRFDGDEGSWESLQARLSSEELRQIRRTLHILYRVIG